MSDDQEHTRRAFFPSEDHQYSNSTRHEGRYSNFTQITRSDDREPGLRSVMIDNASVHDQISLWLQNAPTFSNIISSMEDQAHGTTACNSNIMANDFSSFEVIPASSLPSQQAIEGDETQYCSNEIIIQKLHGLEKGQSSGTKRKHAADYTEIQSTEEIHELHRAEDAPGTILEECKHQQRTVLSAETHNLNERIRRRKLNEKLKALQELVPNCNKRDKALTLDDAINYIKTLQNQVQEQHMMSTGTCFPMFYNYSPLLMPQLGHQGIQIPSLPRFLHANPIRGGIGIEMGMRMGMGGIFPPLSFPMSHLGLPSPYPTTSATSGLPTSGVSTVQNPGILPEPFHSTTSSCMDREPCVATSVGSCFGSLSATRGKTGPSHGAELYNSDELCSSRRTNYNNIHPRLVPPFWTEF